MNCGFHDDLCNCLSKNRKPKYLPKCDVAKSTTIQMGSPGPQGPPGPPGMRIYGDGSAGLLIVEAGQVLDVSEVEGLRNLPAGANLQFSYIEIAGELILPSGTVLRSTSDIIITGMVTVNPGAQDSGNGNPHPGRSLAAAGPYSAGVGLGELQASQILLPGATAGGAGHRVLEGTGGSGGGGIVLLAEGDITIANGAVITADGENGMNPQTMGRGIIGTGGGAGGIIIIAGKGKLTINGLVRARGGNGADGWDGNAGDGEGGGGGGGGGIVHLISTITPIVGLSSINVNGGSGGTNAPGVTGHIIVGGGGGACGGNGGNGGGVPIIGQSTFNPLPGDAGYIFQTIVPAPENLFIDS
jgi:hypothetical protein